MSDTDDLDSIASGSFAVRSGLKTRVVRFAGQEREVERLREKLTKAEKENSLLRQQVRELSRLLGRDVPEIGEEKKADEKDLKGAGFELSEGGVWNPVRRLNFHDSDSVQ